MKVILKKSIPHQEAMKQWAQEVCDTVLKPEKNFVLFLEGGLGTGKTFLVREILRAFGVPKEIGSPTYVFLNEYEGDEGCTFAHFDFYRLNSPEEFFARGFSDVAEDPDISTFVEWPEKVSQEVRNAFSGKKYCIVLEHGVGAGMRKVKLLSNDPY